MMTKKAFRRVPNQRLVDERHQRHWSQQEVADRVGTTPVNVSRWERGVTVPDSYFRYQICSLFEKTAEELGLQRNEVDSHFEQVSEEEFDRQDEESFEHENISELYYLPYRCNPFFTGQESILQKLHDILSCHNFRASRLPLAISGLGGMGKSQVAIEYAYRYRDEYRYIFWLRADTDESLLADLTSIASMINLFENCASEQTDLLNALQLWLSQHTSWLLILDNVEDVGVVSKFLPSAEKGQILLTTRTQITGTIADCINLEKMDLAIGALFLLRRAKFIPLDASLEGVPEVMRAKAQEIVDVLGGLPLALDQAGAYIEETACDLSHYLKNYLAEPITLLNLRGETVDGYPRSVISTLAGSIEQVERSHPAAVELLRFCAFLYPEAIPEEIILQGVAEFEPGFNSTLTDPLILDQAIKELRRFSLLTRCRILKTFSVHRLLQAMIQDSLDKDTQLQWAMRAVAAVSKILPEISFVGKIHDPPCYQRYLLHVQNCISLIKQWDIVTLDAIYLLQRAGRCLYYRGRYQQAEQLFQQAIAICRRTVKSSHPTAVECLNDLALLYSSLGKNGPLEQPDQHEPISPEVLSEFSAGV